MRFVVLILLLSIIIPVASADLNISVIPFYDRANLEPVLIVSVENAGDAPVYNVSTNLSFSGLDISKGMFSSGNNSFSQRLSGHESQNIYIQFKYPKSKDDIVVSIIVKYQDSEGEHTDQVRLTVPAIIVMNLNGENVIKSAMYVFALVVISILFYQKIKK